MEQCVVREAFCNTRFSTQRILDRKKTDAIIRDIHIRRVRTTPYSMDVNHRESNLSGSASRGRCS